MNKKVKVVVVDDNEAVTGSVKRYFSSSDSIEIVECLKNGMEAIDYISTKSSNFDLVVLDIVLAHFDGIRILEEMKKRKINKKVIVLSSFGDDYTVKKVQELGANYFMLKPVDMNVLETRITELVSHNDPVQISRLGKAEMEISTLLHNLGIPSHVRGYKYIRDGVMILYANDGLVTLVTKEIYPQIASKYDTTTARVERAIRHAIEISWTRGDIKLMEEIFGNSIDFDRSRPTNAEFLTGIADRFRMMSKTVTM